MNPDGHGCRRRAGFRAGVKNPWWRMVLVLVLVLDFSRVFDDEDENEEEGTFWCLSNGLFSLLCRASFPGARALKRTEFCAPLDARSPVFIRVHPCSSVVSIFLR